MRPESMPRAQRTQEAFKEYAVSKDADKPIPSAVEPTRYDQLSRQEIEELYGSPDGLFNKASDLVLTKGFKRLAESLGSERVPVPDLVAFIDTSARPLAIGAKPIIDAIAAKKGFASPEHHFLVLFHDTRVVEYEKMRKSGQLDAWREREGKAVAARLSWDGDETPVQDMMDQLEQTYAKAWDACSGRLRGLIKATAERTGKDPINLLFVDDFYSTGRTLGLLAAILKELGEDPTLPRVEKAFFAFFASLPKGQQTEQLEERCSQELDGTFLHGTDRAEDFRLERFAGFPYTKNAGFAFNDDQMEERSRSKAAVVGVKKVLGEPLAQRIARPAAQDVRRMREHIEVLARPFIDASQGQF